MSENLDAGVEQMLQGGAVRWRTDKDGNSVTVIQGIQQIHKVTLGAADPETPDHVRDAHASAKRPVAGHLRRWYGVGGLHCERVPGGSDPEYQTSGHPENGLRSRNFHEHHRHE